MTNITQTQTTPVTKHITCAPTKFINELRSNRKSSWIIIPITLIILLGPLCIAVIRNKDFLWVLGKLSFWYWPSLVVLLFMTWTIFGPRVSKIVTFSTVELDFSENALFISFPLVKRALKLTIPWTAISEISHESCKEGYDRILLFFNDACLELQVRSSIKSYFGSGILYGSPSWYDKKSDRWVLGLRCDPPATDLMNLIHDWRSYVVPLTSTARVIPPDPTVPVMNQPLQSSYELTQEIIPININAASFDELITLSGVGAEEAKTIIERRPFSSVEAAIELIRLKPHHAKHWENCVYASNGPPLDNSQLPEEPNKSFGGRTID